MKTKTNLPDEDDGQLQEEPEVTFLRRIEVDGWVAVVHHPAGHSRRDEGPDGERESPHDHLVELKLGREPVVGLALPLLRMVASQDVVGVLQY